MKRYCLTVDLAGDPSLIDEYKQRHKPENLWPEIQQSIRDAGILNMEIFCLGNRLCMLMETEDNFSFERKEALDAANPKVQEWEQAMWAFQRPLPWAEKGEKWMLMEKIYQL